jgi:very-short-patch-repair endonuclease
MANRGFGNEDDDFDLEGTERRTTGGAMVSIGGKLPHCFEVPTSKLLDVIVQLSPRGRNADTKERKKLRKALNQKIYTKTRPGFYMEVGHVLHFAYMGQPNGAGSQHWWRIFCADELKSQVETILAGTALVSTAPPAAENGAGGNYTTEWGGLYLRSTAEIKIAEALDRTGLLFFANVRGRVGLQNTTVSDSQLTGRVEVDFMMFHQGKGLILEVDGQHHLEDGQIIRDYARDRVLLRSGLPTVRFTAQDCLNRPDDVVSECLSILMSGPIN